MPLQFEPEFPQQLKTATAIADPVLIRLTTAAQHVLLLAEHATYDRAGLVRLYAVRTVTRPRGWRGLVTGAGEPGTHPQINLRKDSQWVLAGIPGMPTLRVGSGRRTFALVALSRVQYEAFLAATPRRLLQASGRRAAATPRRSTVASALSAMHRLRFALHRAMLSATPR
jgi:hypothetical protein